MSQSRKILKLISFAQFVFAIVALVLGAVSLAGAGSAMGQQVTTLGNEMDAALWATTMGTLLVLDGALSLVASVLGIRGANRPSKLGSHRLLSALGVIAALAAMVLSGVGGILVVALILFLLDAEAVVFDARVRKESER